MSLTSSRIRALNAVIDEGSYSAAARRLGMSQPAVSQAVQDLERAYGVDLFERRGRHLIPTSLCLELAPLAQEIKSLEDAANSLLKRREELTSGILRVSIGSLQPGMNLVGAFQKKFPGVQVQLEYTVFAEVVDAVLNGRADVGILPDVPDDARFQKQVCLKHRIVALAPITHRLSAMGEIGLEDLKGERLIFQQKGSVTQRILDRTIKKLALDIRPALVLKTHGEVYEAVTSGLGIGFIWDRGTNRRDGTHRLMIRDVATPYKEELFRRRDMRNRAADMFFAAAKDDTLLVTA